MTWKERDVSRSFVTFVSMLRWVDIPDSDWGDFRHWCAVDRSSYLCFESVYQIDSTGLTD